MTSLLLNNFSACRGRGRTHLYVFGFSECGVSGVGPWEELLQVASGIIFSGDGEQSKLYRIDHEPRLWAHPAMTKSDQTGHAA